MSWQVQNLVCVVFAPPAAGATSAFDLWQTLIGSSPHQFQQGLPNGQEGTLASGPIGENQLTVSVQIGRVEAGLLADAKGVPSDIPSLSNIPTALEQIVGIGEQLCSQTNPVRVALVANCSKPFASLEEANASFAKEAHLPFPPDQASDLQFAMNVRRNTGGAGWQMNRLCRWSVGRFEMVRFQVSGAGGAAQQVPQFLTAKHLSTLLIDLNTVARQTPLGPTQAAAALRDIAVEMQLIMSEGYDRLIAPAA